MSIQEFGNIVAYLKTAYPNSNFLPTQEAIKTWYGELKDLDYKACCIAMKGYVRNNEYPPSIAAIIKACSKENQVQVIPWDQAWEKVIHSVRKYGSYGAREAMEELDDTTKRAVKAIGGFREICTTNNLNSLRREFKESYAVFKAEIDYGTNANPNIVGIEDRVVKN